MLDKLRSLLQSRLIQSSGIYTFSGILERAVPFILLPVFTRYLSTADYGIVAMFTVLVSLARPFTGLGVKAAVMRSYYKEEFEFDLYVSNALFILCASSFIVLIIVQCFSGFISRYSSVPSGWLWTVVVVSFAQFLHSIVLTVWQAKDNPKPYGIFQVLSTALSAISAVLLVLVWGFGWEAKVIGQVIAYVFFAVLGVFVLKKNKLLKFSIVKSYIKHALHYGVPLIPHVLSSVILTMTDRMFITNMVGVSETGIYTVGYQIGMIIGVLATSFNKAWTPWLYKKLNEGKIEMKKKIVSFTYGYFVLIIALALILSLIAPWFMQYLVGEQFYGSVAYIIWIAIGYAFNGMYFMVTNYIFYEEKTHLLSLMTFVAAAINMILNYFLILAYGAVGAAIATAITYVIQFLLTWVLAIRVYKMPWLHMFKPTK